MGILLDLDGHDKAILAGGLALILLHGMALVRAALIAQWAKIVKRSLAKLCAMVRHRHNADPGGVKGAVHQQVQAMALDTFRATSGVCSFVLALIVSMLVFQIVVGADRFHTVAQDVMVLVVYCIHMMLHCVPSTMNSRMIDVWYSVLMVLNCLYISPPFCSPSYYLPFATVMPMCHTFGLSMGRLNVAVVIVWTGIYLVTAILAFMSRYENDRLLFFWFGISGLFAASVCLCTASLEEHWEALARRDIETKSLKEKETACNALLRIFYDVVLELDSNLKIESSGQELAAFLGCNPGRSLTGTPLGELVPDSDDRQLLAQRMGQAPNREAMAQVMHLLLRDGDRDSRKVELLSFQFAGPGGRTCHLVGIREFGDETLGQPAGPLVVARERSFLPEELAALGDLTIKVNAARPDLRVIECSDSFQYVIGTLIPGKSLFTLVEAGQQLQDWYQHVMNLHLSGENEDVVERANACTVRLRPWGEPSVRITATCCVGLEDSADEGDDSCSFIVCLVFSNLKREVVVTRHSCQSSFTLGSSIGSSRSSSSSGGSSSRPKRKRQGTPSKNERSRLGQGEGQHQLEECHLVDKYSTTL